MKKLLLFLCLFVSSLHAVNLKMSPASLPNGTVGAAYSATVMASGGGSFTWQLMGSLPPGLTGSGFSSSYFIGGNPSQGSCTANTTCNYTFYLTAKSVKFGRTVTRLYNIGIVVPPAPPPPPPVTHVVHLTWTASASPNVLSNNVYRGTVAGGPYQRIATGIASTMYDDSTVQSGLTYFYVVTAVDNQPLESAYSNEAQAVISTP